jgi:single-stranded-DNA-specific exonuclease
MSSRLVELVLAARGLTDRTTREAFLHPDYQIAKHDPFLLPDMDRAVERLIVARQNSEQVVIYGDYDIDGLTATSVLLDSFEKFGIKTHTFIPNRFVEGYGLSSDAIERLAADGAQLIVTVDCGSLSHKEIARANELGVDVIVTDHHSVAETMPDAVATINPKRTDHNYPFIDLAGVGVAFKLVQALQTKMDGLPAGHEKWLLDLVALGTVCDVVELRDENRANVYWGLEVMKKTRRPGIRALMAVSGVTAQTLNARSLGFALGPRLNAAGRLETARLSLDLLTATDGQQALALAQKLDIMNTERRAEQDRIFQAAIIQADERADDPVLIVSDPSWSHGIIGIVAAKLLERYYKPTFVLQELEDGTAKGSARSFGEFSAVAAIRATEEHLIKGGGHKLAAGVTLQTTNISIWRDAMRVYHRSLKLENQLRFLEPAADVTLDDFELWNEQEFVGLEALEPYGMGNPQPVLNVGPLSVITRRTMGADNQHVKYGLSDKNGERREFIAFNAADKFLFQPGDTVRAWAEPTINEWRGRRSAEGRLLKLEEYIQ